MHQNVSAMSFALSYNLLPIYSSTANTLHENNCPAMLAFGGNTTFFFYTYFTKFIKTLLIFAFIFLVSSNHNL